MLNERIQKQNDTLCMSSFIWLPGTGKIKATENKLVVFGRQDWLPNAMREFKELNK